MGMTAIRGSSYSGRVLSRLGAWPALRTGRAQCGVGVGISAGTRQVLHLHSADEADLRLTRPVIDRLRDAIEESGRVRADAEGDWVSVRLESERDVDLLLSLLSVAIQANGDPPRPNGDPSQRNGDPSRPNGDRKGNGDRNGQAAPCRTARESIGAGRPVRPRRRGRVPDGPPPSGNGPQTSGPARRTDGSGRGGDAEDAVGSVTGSVARRPRGLPDVW